MEITFLGVGEAFDENLPNTSMLICTEQQEKPVTVLLDCGYSVPPRFWQLGLDVETLDAIWISHFHADHAFGLPALLVRFWEEKRIKDLYFLGQKGIESFVLKCLDLAYPNFQPRLEFSLHFIEVEPEEAVTALGLSWKTAVNDHPQRDLALRLDAEGISMFYSGDGRPTSETRGLAEGVHLIVHEAFHLSKDIPGHGTVAGCLDMARSCRAKRLALVHIQRDVRRERFDEIKEMVNSVEGLEVLIPKPGDRLSI
ncbi:MAG: ribonuclease Z [Deltaproteobacteria bacterium]|jgi:ribonuclease Z|nr:ribonuclease Z [Deltaproteobacteria bacterium]